MSEVSGNTNKKPSAGSLFLMLMLTCYKNKHDDFMASYSASNVTTLIWKTADFSRSKVLSYKLMSYYVCLWFSWWHCINNTHAEQAIKIPFKGIKAYWDI